MESRILQRTNQRYHQNVITGKKSSLIFNNSELSKNANFKPDAFCNDPLSNSLFTGNLPRLPFHRLTHRINADLFIDL